MTDETLATEPAAAVDATPADVTPTEVTPAPTMEETIREKYRELTAPERARDPHGRFARADGSEPAPEQSAAPEAPEAATEPVPEPAPEPKPWDAAPNTWKKELQAEFGKLPPSVREEIHRRENDFHKGIAQYKEAAGFGQAMFQDVSPHFDAMREIGATPQEVVRDTLAAWRQLSTGTPEQKRTTLLRLADGFGISLGELAAPPNGAPAAPPEIAPVLQRLQRLESTLTESQRAQEQAHQAALLSEAEKFLTDPKHEHMEAVFDDVLALVRAGTPPEDAYNKAIWAHPETRAKLLASQEAERKQREAAEAAAARKAAAVNVKRRGTPPAAPTRGTMEDTIRETYRRLQS